MSWKDRCLSFIKKYGKVAKVVAGGVLNVVAPSWSATTCVPPFIRP